MSSSLNTSKAKIYIQPLILWNYNQNSNNKNDDKCIHTDKHAEMVGSNALPLADTISSSSLPPPNMFNIPKTNLRPYSNNDQTVCQKYSVTKGETTTTTKTTTCKKHLELSSLPSNHSVNLNSSQKERWMAKYKEVLHFYEQHGHAAVPDKYQSNPGLAFWVKRQRRQYKLYKEGKPSRLNSERMDLLNNINFVWDGHETSWTEHFEALKKFREEHHHCNVPISYKNKKLAIWVKRHRRYYKHFFEGKVSAHVTPERIVQLENIGFQWVVRRRR